MARLWVLVPLWLVLAGCAGPVGAYHSIEGGAIAEDRAPPPGADLPYPNLASVPAAPIALTPAQQGELSARLNPAAGATQATVANPAALVGLDLPGAAPPPPDIPGLAIPRVPTPAPAVLPLAAPPARKAVATAPVSVSFEPGSAILSADMVSAIQAIADAHGRAVILAGGFGEAQAGPDDAALTLGLARAVAIADALTANGVPPGAIRLIAAAAGSGGFVQLVY